MQLRQFEFPGKIKMGLSAAPRAIIGPQDPSITPWPTADPLGAIDSSGHGTHPGAIEK